MSVLPRRFNNKPQYVFHPARALRRALHGVSRASESPAREIAQLPWGLPLEVHRSDSIGFSILTGGVFDPCVSETLHRLIDAGDVVVDVGANVGYLTSLAAARAGERGSVIACEPHPEVYGLLAANASRWERVPGTAPVELHQLAVSDQAGTSELDSGPAFHANMGLAALRPDADAMPADGGRFVEVELVTLDGLMRGREVGLLKIDVEGHEGQVLRGAGELLGAGAIRDIVFEDHPEYPSEATAVVEAAGYTLLSLDNDLFGLTLGAPEDRGEVAAWPGPSYLATRDPVRARTRLLSRGWQIKGIGPTPRWHARRRRVA